MFTIYRYFKTGLSIAMVASLTWFAAHSFAQGTSEPLTPPPIEELELKPKMLSEMTAAEKAKLSKEELEKLKKLEEKMKKLEEIKEKPGY